MNNEEMTNEVFEDITSQTEEAVEETQDGNNLLGAIVVTVVIGGIAYVIRRCHKKAKETAEANPSEDKQPAWWIKPLNKSIEKSGYTTIDLEEYEKYKAWKEKEGKK